MACPGCFIWYVRGRTSSFGGLGGEPSGVGVPENSQSADCMLPEMGSGSAETAAEPSEPSGEYIPSDEKRVAGGPS